jgi:hypothetical protein
MAFTLKKIFSKSEPSEIAVLRKQDEQNKAELALHQKIADRGTAVREGRHVALVAMCSKMTMESVEEFVAAAQASNLAKDWDEAARIVGDSVQNAIVERTRQPLLDALGAIQSKLIEQIESIHETEKSHGAKFGVEIGHEESIIIRAVTVKLKQAEKYIHTFSHDETTEYAEYGAMSTAIMWILND